MGLFCAGDLFCAESLQPTHLKESSMLKLPPLRVVACGFCLLGVLTLQSRSARSQEDGLLKSFPASANALAVIDVQSLLNTQMAKEGEWGDPTSIEHGSRPLRLPALADRVAVAAQLDAGDNLSRIWELAVMQLSQPVPLQKIALREGGYLDELAGGVQAVWTPSDTYFVQLNDNRLGAMYPANRQTVTRWVQSLESNPSLQLSDYLLQAAADLRSDTPIVMALDLQGVVQPHRVRESLEDSRSMAGQEASLDKVAKLLVGLQGITLSVQVDQQATGTIRIDFSEDVSAFGRLAKPLFLEALQRFNAVIPDVESWKVELLGSRVVLSGPLSASGLRRIGSLLEPPSTKFSDLRDAAPAESGSDPYVLASQQYYRSVHTLIADLRETLGDTRDNHALWMERFGRKIDALPILNVDPDLLDWGASVSETFREMSVTTRSANVRAGTRKAYVNTGASYDGYGYGSGGWYNDATGSAKQKTQIDRSEQGAARIQRFGSWKEVEDADAQIRIAMTQKYNAEF
jgi:hypothetical protein